MQDTWKLGGHEFTSRFILGSGKYDLNLIKAAVEDARRPDYHPGAAPGQHRGHRKHSGLHPQRGHPAAQHQRRPECRGSGADCPAGSGDGLRRLYQNRSDPRVQIPAAGQLRDHQGYRNSGQGGLCSDALYVPGSERGPGSGQRRGRRRDAFGRSYRFQQGTVHQGIYPDSGGRNRPACDRGRWYRPSQPGLRSDGEGAAALMANTAIATAGDIPAMAGAFRKAIEAGRAAYLSGLGRVRQTASASSPLTGFLQD